MTDNALGLNSFQIGASAAVLNVVVRRVTSVFVLCLYIPLTDVKPLIDLLIKNKQAHASL